MASDFIRRMIGGMPAQGIVAPDRELACARFAWVNRQLITWAIRGAWARRTVLVHRKGATRAFPPGHPDLAPEFRATGQPVLIPGSMGTASYVLAGADEAMRLSFGSACHGAGRRMSRHDAKKLQTGEALREELADRGILVRTDSVRDLAEEAPCAYKDVHEVVDVVARAGIARPVARLVPLAVIKG